MESGRFSAIALLTILFFLPLGSCKLSDSYLAEDTTTAETVTLMFQSEMDTALQIYFEALRGTRSLTLRELDNAARTMNSSMSAAVEYVQPSQGSSSRVRSRNRSKPGFNSQAYKDIYRGVRTGDRVFIFKLANQPVFSKIDKWTVFTWVGASLLNDPISGKYTATEEQVRYVLDTKIYEKRRIKAKTDLVNAADFVVHFIPGYAGAEKVFYTGKSPGDKLLGVVEIVGDAASLGLGSKIRVVQKTAAVITISAASARVGAASYKAATGQANWSTGIDAFIGTLEIGLSAFTLVKLKINRQAGKVIVDNLDEAEILGKQLNRSAADIKTNGISEEEFFELTGKRLRQGAPVDVPSGKTRSLDDFLASMGCAVSGFSLATRKCEHVKALFKGIPVDFGDIKMVQISDTAFKKLKSRPSDYFKAVRDAIAKGKVGPKGNSGIVPSQVKGLKYKIKLKKASYGDLRLNGAVDENGVLLLTKLTTHS